MRAFPNPPKQIFLRPGEMFLGSEPAEVTTVLGSCVAVTMFVPRAGVAAICHAMLTHPRSPPGGDSVMLEPYKYVSLAIPAMINFFQRHGLPSHRIEVKLFGGANVFPAPPQGKARPGIGAANVELALQLLKAADLEPACIQAGGVIGRKLIFNTVSGQVLLKRLKPSLIESQSADPLCLAPKLRSWWSMTRPPCAKP